MMQNFEKEELFHEDSFLADDITTILDFVFSFILEPSIKSNNAFIDEPLQSYISREEMIWKRHF